MIKKNALLNIQKNYDFYSEWIDYARLNLDWPIKEFDVLLEKLNLSNSKDFVFSFKDINLSVEKVWLNNGVWLKFSIPYKTITVPLFIYAKYFDYIQNQFKTYWKIDLYGGFYRLQELWFFNLKEKEKEFLKNKNWDLFLEFLFKQIWNLQLTRLDYRLDFFKKYESIPIFWVSKIFDLRKNSKYREWKKWGVLESWDIWNRASKRVLVRWYDKLIDSETKNKFLLYADYFENKSVHRLEFEFLNHFITWYTYNEIPQFLEKVKDYIEVNKKYKIYKTYDKTDLSDILDRFKYYRMSKWYIKWLVQNNINIFEVLDEIFLENWFDNEKINDIFKEYLIRKKSFLTSYDNSDFANDIIKSLTSKEVKEIFNK